MISNALKQKKPAEPVHPGYPVWKVSPFATIYFSLVIAAVSLVAARLQLFSDTNNGSSDDLVVMTMLRMRK